MKTFFASALIASVAVSTDMSAQDRANQCNSSLSAPYSIPTQYWYDCTGNARDMNACQEICTYWCTNTWYLDYEGVQACQMVMDAEPAGPSFEECVEDIGRQVTDALEGLNVDVEGIARWVEEKAEELKNMEDRHDREWEDLNDEIAQEGEVLANQAAQAAANTIADRIRDFADQLEGGSGGDAEGEGEDTASGDTVADDTAAADTAADDTAAADGPGVDPNDVAVAADDWWLQKQLEKERMRSRQTHIKNNFPRSMLTKEPWDLYDSCHTDGNLTDCREICTNGWQDDWFVAEEIADSCGLCVNRPTNDQIYNACVDDLNVEACSFTCYYGPRDPWFLESEIMQGCLVVGFSKGGMDLSATRDAFERVAGWWQDQEQRHKEEDETLGMETVLELGPHVQDAVQVVGDMITDSVWDRADSVVDAIYEQAERETDMLQEAKEDLAALIQEAITAVEAELNAGGDDTPMPVDDWSDIGLASKGMTVKESSSNAAYYCAGATLVGAAAVAFCLLQKKENKDNQTPFLSSDDDYLTAKL